MSTTFHKDRVVLKTKAEAGKWCDKIEPYLSKKMLISFSGITTIYEMVKGKYNCTYIKLCCLTLRFFLSNDSMRRADSSYK